MMGTMGKMAALAAEPGEDAFRKLFRFYRQSRPGTADLGAVIDFTQASPARGTCPKVLSSPLSVSSVSEQDACRAGLQPVSKWKAYGLEGYPGFIFIPNPFLPGYQRHWVKQCLKLYSRKPNVCNLDKHMVAEEIPDLWGQSQELLRHIQLITTRLSLQTWLTSQNKWLPHVDFRTSKLRLESSITTD
uniref:AlkB homolog 1, histone H2A dioxygenase n=1 Tax=Sarcophilus harrisii TaxID=9305 RepID=A0A7N4NKM3_SARHA